MFSTLEIFQSECSNPSVENILYWRQSCIIQHYITFLVVIVPQGAGKAKLSTLATSSLCLTSLSLSKAGKASRFKQFPRHQSIIHSNIFDISTFENSSPSLLIWMQMEKWQIPAECLPTPHLTPWRQRQRAPTQETCEQQARGLM